VIIVEGTVGIVDGMVVGLTIEFTFFIIEYPIAAILITNVNIIDNNSASIFYKIKIFLFNK
jgi:ABC-type thiamin/hydroxymethylpyrimidine transport system permease subunit